MKKLKVILAVLFAMLLSCALFACTNGNEDDDTMVIKSNVSVGTIELTDSDGETEYATKSAAISSVWTTNLTGSQRTVTLKGTELTFSGTVEFGEVGTYTVTVTPKENNSGHVSATTTVTISHDFQPVEGQEGVEECAHDGARRTTTEQDVTLHYGTFHTGTAATVPSALGGGSVFTNNSDDKSLITEFGTVDMNGKDVTVPTVTAGRLEPGVTITVRGQAKSTYSDWDVDNAYYYFPVVGIADPYLNGSNVDPYPSFPNYTGGTSVLVRGEGWVLYNGIGETSQTRALASLSGGTSDAYNYGSHDSDTGNAQPSGYVLGQMPDPSSSDWKDWWVYSQGQTCNSGDQYTDMTDLEITWYYRTDGIIEITYNYDYKNTGNNRVLTAYIKVPAATRGYYQTILHGDYVDITISEIVTIETLTTTDFEYVSMNESGTVYYEGQSFDATAINARIQYAQLEGWQTYSISAVDVYATTSTVTDESDDTDDVEWFNLADYPMSSEFKSYKIELVKSQKTWTQYIPANTIKVIANGVASARGEDDTKIGAFTVGTTTSGGEGAVLLTLPTSANHYVVGGENGKTVVVRLLNNGYQQFDISSVSATGEAGTVALAVAKDGDEVVLTLTLTEATKVTVSGLQDSDIVLDLTSLTGFKVDSASSGEVTLNGGGEVTLTYNLGTTAIGDVTVSVNGGMALGKSDLDSDLVEEGFALGGGVTYVSHSYNETDNVLTLVVNVPAANIAGFTATTKHTVTLTISGVVETADTIYYGMGYDENLENDKGVVLGDGMYTFVENGKIYLAFSMNASEIESEWLGYDEFTVNVNNGDIDNVWLLNLGFETVNGTIAYLKPADLPAGVEISYVVVGTIDDASDIDHGVLVLVSIDVSALDIEGDYAYEYMPDYNSDLVYYAVSDDEITVKNGSQSLEKAVVTEGNCLETGLAAYEVTDGQGNVVFYLGVSKLAGMHVDEDGNGICDLCGGEISTGYVSGAWYSGYISEDIEDGETFEFQGTYSKIGSSLGGGMSVLVRQFSDGKEEVIYNLNGNGYGEVAHASEGGSNVWEVRDQPYNAEVSGFESGYVGFTNSLITTDHPYNTLNGALDSDGNPIDGASLYAAAIGGTFRYIVAFDGDTITVNMRLYKEGVSLNGTPYFNFTYTIAVKDGATYNVLVCGSDGLGTLVDDTCTFIKSVKNNSVLVSGTSESGLTFSDPTVDADGYATLVASGLAAKDGNNYYAEFTLDFSQKLVDSTTATVKNAAGSVVENATATYDAAAAKLTVSIPVSETTKGVYTIELANLEGSTMQTDIKIDLSNIGFAEYGFEVGENSLDLAGGSITLTVDGLTSLDGYKLSVNGSDAAAIAANAKIGGLVVDSVDGATIVLSVESIDFTKALTAYTIELVDTSAVAAITIDNVTLPTDNLIEGEAIYVAQSGTTLSFVFTGAVATPSTEDFKLNINQGGETAQDDRSNVLLYDLGFHITANGAGSFTENNWLTRNATVVYSYVSGKAVVAINIDLAKAYNIEAGESYAFEAYVLGASTALYYQVTGGELSLLSADPEAASDHFVNSTCDTLATSAKAITVDGSVVLYYDIVGSGASHSWSDDVNEDGYYVCSECGALYRPGDARNRTIAASYLEGVATNGLTVSFWGRGDSPQDWFMESLKTTVGNLYLMLPNLGGASKTALTDAQKEAINALREGVSDAFDRIDQNAWPGNHASVGKSDWDTLDQVDCYITIVISPTDGIKFYKNGVLAIAYDAKTEGNSGSNEVTEDPWTIGDYAQAFLALAEHGGVQFATANLKKAESLLVQTKALDADAVATRYANYLAEKGFLPQHIHEYDPETDRCPDDNALNPNHVHAFDSNGECFAGDAKQITVESNGNSYEGVISQDSDFANNDTGTTWWAGSTSDLVLSGDAVAVITWENTRDKDYFDYAIEVQFTVNDSGRYIDFDPASQWTALYLDGEAVPTLTGETSGTFTEAGVANAGYGTYKATVMRIGTVLTVVVEFTANGAESVTWTRTGTATGVTTDDFSLRVAGNPYFLDNFVAYYGTVTQVTD